ncbi:hypothetical protein ACFV6B_39500 [Streptomyces microflavus]|uniref:hypothetical protein n=1 Tax=Streptomyces microflavus TaxID=1919 RepID=UPI0036670C86
MSLWKKVIIVGATATLLAGVASGAASADTQAEGGEAATSASAAPTVAAGASQENEDGEVETQRSKRFHLLHRMDGDFTLTSTAGDHEGVPANGSILNTYPGPTLNFEAYRPWTSDQTLYAYFDVAKDGEEVGQVKVGMTVGWTGSESASAEFIGKDGVSNTDCLTMVGNYESWTLTNSGGIEDSVTTCWS